ncbi:UNVERIFIED_CONTAM: hypothetical protein GTU68_035175, partial [Idotea baltica]|nr:hypothetical protein [Idotea baltica]
GETILGHNQCLLKHLFPSHIKILLGLKTKSLSFTGTIVQSDVLSCEDASHLEHLSLFYGGNGDKTSKVCNFLFTASQLTHLECRDFCNNTMLGIISLSYHNLYSLDLRGGDVTDEGVLRLCGIQQNLRQCIEVLNRGDRIFPVSKCSQTLKQIKLTMTKVTEAGVAIILLVLTKIFILRVPDITMKKLFTFLKEIDHKNIESNLKEFHSREILDENQLTVLTGLCPNLEYIQMSFVGNFEIDLISLQKLTRLRRLSGAKFADVNALALMAFLSEMGNQLTYLFLYAYRNKFSQENLKITHTHLWNLASACTNLKNLTVDGYCLEEETFPIIYDAKNLKPFKNLRTLKLISMNPSYEDLKVFLYKCTNMETLELEFKDTHVLHDRLIGELLDAGVWKNLRTINIRNSQITSKMLFRLVDECPNLQVLGSLNSWLLSKDQIVHFKERVQRENLDIKINY